MSSRILERVMKWRNVYRLMATMGSVNASERWIKDGAEKALMHRVELSALAALLIQKGIITPLEFSAQIEIEAEVLDETMQKAFPGFTVHDAGVTMTNPEAKVTMDSWRRPVGTG